MSVKDILVGQGKRLASSPTLLRLMTDDRVMRLFNGVMDGQQRVRDASEKAGEAWHLLLHGRGMPTIDPALDDDIPTVSADARRPPATNGAGASSPGVNGTSVNGAHSEAAGVKPAAAAAKPATQPAPSRSASDDLASSIASRTSLANLGGRDVFEKCFQFTTTENARKMGVYPYFKPLDKNDGPEAVLDGRRVLMLGSNNYLGLTTHPKVREAAQQAIRDYGTSMTGSRLVNGSMKMHRELEEKLAAFMGKESALVFTAGYQVNLSTISALLSNKKAVAVIDRNDHASIYDGVRLGQAAGARMVRYKHNDPQSLERCLSELAPDEGAFVITDGVFSTEGELLRLPEMLPIIKRYNARLFIDDAHSLGVVGPGGRGTAHHFGLADDVDLIGGTFSKSLASIGGWLVGDPKVLEYIKHFAPSFMFAASAAPPCVAAAMAALEVMQEEPWRITKLGENADYMRNELRRLGFDVGHSQTSIVPIYVREDLRTIFMWKELLDEHGVYTNPFISPGVPPKQAMLRTSYMATHTREQLLPHEDRAQVLADVDGHDAGLRVAHVEA
ncbi:MAG: aminotransferase class I/II-fold pyridoxal phosphate-dependent enzyme, partial [Myxococcales bacterium]